MQDTRPDRDPRELSALAGGQTAAARSRALRRSRLWRGAAIGCVILAAMAIIVGPHLIGGSPVSNDNDRADPGSGGVLPATKVRCPVDPIARNAVKPTGAVQLAAAVICHFPAGVAGTKPVSGAIPSSQLDDLSADMSANSVAGPLSGVPGQAPSASHPEEWVVVAVTSTGEHVQLLASSYPTEYMWDGLGPGLVWHPSSSTQSLLAGDLPH